VRRKWALMILAAIDYPNLNPAALTLPGFELFGRDWGPFPLRWYALAYIAGLLLGWRWMVRLIRTDRLWKPGKAPLSVMQADDFLFWATLGVILGGRIGYVLFYKPDMIWLNPAEIVQIWNGGMSFHGGLIGVALATFWFTRRLHVDEERFAALAKDRIVAAPPDGERKNYVRVSKLGWMKKDQAVEIEAKTRTVKLDLIRLGDLAAAATPVGLFFGRIANFINGELWGRKTDAPWGMVFCNERVRASNGGYCPAGMDPRHPSQLYEAALEGLVLFAIINLATLRFESLRRPGMNIGLFLFFYGLARASLELVREPDAHLPDALRGYITLGMLLSLPMIGIGAWLIRRALKAPISAAA
jgi:phosphatidylglycerol---prolipoprotein diacylglyceryl transferase